MAAATYSSVQITAIAAGTHLGAGRYKTGSDDRPIFHGELAFGTGIMAKSEDAAMVSLPIGVIPFQVGILVSESLGSAKFSIGIVGTTAKYRALAVQTNLASWVWYMLETAWDAYGPNTAVEEIRITNDATAAFPTTSGGSINLAFECLVP
jgi:hypothetical protein